MKDKNNLHKAWSEMPTAQLDEVLQQELRKENPSEEVVLGIMHILREREEECPVELSGDIRDAWKQYSKRSAASRKTNRKRMWFVSTAAAAAVCIVILAIPQRAGAQSIFDAFFRWTECVFEFFAPEETVPKPSAEYVFLTDNPGLQQVYDEVAEQGVTNPVVPTWVPEGYVLTELKSLPIQNGKKVCARLQLNDSSIVLSYKISAEIIATQYKKEDSGVEVYESANVCHFIMNNGKNISITWTVDGTECSVYADLERDDVYKLIDSIYKKDLL